MITNLKEAKTKLSALVVSVERGEDVVITVRGKPKARLTAIGGASHDSMVRWKDELVVLQRKYGTGKKQKPGASALDTVREERF